MTVRDILAAVVRQILERSSHLQCFPRLLSIVEPMYQQHKRERTKPTQSELLHAIRDICRCFSRSFFFIDGLDEAVYDEQFDLLDALKTIEANFFITSRPLIRLKDVLSDVEFFDIAAQNDDIELLVASQINRSPDLCAVLFNEELKNRVAKKICETSCGM